MSASLRLLISFQPARKTTAWQEKNNKEAETENEPKLLWFMKSTELLSVCGQRHLK